MNVDPIREALVKCDQTHLLTFWEELDDTRRRELIADVAKIDFGQVVALIPTHVRSVPTFELAGDIQPPPLVRARPGSPEYVQGRARGKQLISEGKVAALVVAGGQGTRLGFDGPKGLFEITPVRNKSLFRLFAESILATQKRYGGVVPWYIMTSEANDAATREYFEGNAYFGLNPGDVVFFQQGVMPALDADGRILLAEKHRVALSPDGHGGTLRALAATGALGDMAGRGIEAVSYFQVDNPLVSPAEPLFVGLHDLQGSEASSIAVPKADDLERVGNFARVDGKVCVIEYSDLPDELAHARDPDGSRTLDAGSIAVHMFSRRFLERVTSGGEAAGLPWHRAIKKVPFIDLATGQRVEPEVANAVKLEMFVFDTLPLAEKAMVLEASRGEVFSPVKNAEGIDSPATARRDLIRRAAQWLRGCGVDIPATPAGEPDAVLEISPLLAVDAEQLGEVLDTPPAVSPGGTLYLE